MEKTKQIDAIIFDCDGVLIDSESILELVDISILSDMGIILSREEYHSAFSGTTHQQTIDVISKRYKQIHQKDLDATFSEDLKQMRRDGLEKELIEMPGTISALGDVKVVLAVASNTADDIWLRKKLKGAGLEDFFKEHIYSAQHVKNAKPEPDLFLHTAEKLGIAPEKCVVVEDSPLGVQAGVAAGMHVIGFTGASHLDHTTHKVRLEAAGADAVVENMDELALYFKQIGIA